MLVLLQDEDLFLDSSSFGDLVRALAKVDLHDIAAAYASLSLCPTAEGERKQEVSVTSCGVSESKSHDLPPTPLTGASPTTASDIDHKLQRGDDLLLKNAVINRLGNELKVLLGDKDSPLRWVPI